MTVEEFRSLKEGEPIIVNVERLKYGSSRANLDIFQGKTFTNWKKDEANASIKLKGFRITHNIVKRAEDLYYVGLLYKNIERANKLKAIKELKSVI